jgi:myo-inositol catabolism protein IolC
MTETTAAVEALMAVARALADTDEAGVLAILEAPPFDQIGQANSWWRLAPDVIAEHWDEIGPIGRLVCYVACKEYAETLDDPSGY